MKLAADSHYLTSLFNFFNQLREHWMDCLLLRHTDNWIHSYWQMHVNESLLQQRQNSYRNNILLVRAFHLHSTARTARSCMVLNWAWGGLIHNVPKGVFLLAGGSWDLLDNEQKCICHMTNQKENSSAFMALLKKARLIWHHGAIDAVWGFTG